MAAVGLSSATSTPPGATGIVSMRLAIRNALHPEVDLHPSWLPPAWNARHRARLRHAGPAARAVLGDVLRDHGIVVATTDFAVTSRVARLALLDGASLRRLAAWLGLCAHAPLLRERSRLGAQVRRQAARLDDDAVGFVVDRTPALTELRMATPPLVERPCGCGHRVLERGYRLLIGLVATAGDGPLQRALRKLPRRVSTLPVPSLSARQVAQLEELSLLCLIPERLQEWDWLF